MRRECKPTCLLVIFLIIISDLLVFAGDQNPPKSETRIIPEINAYRINPHPPTIDGILDDAIWKSKNIERSTTFTQQEPDEGMVPTESTMVAIAYDDDALYVAFWCYDSEPTEVMRQLVRRDRYSEADNVSVCIDAFHDHQSCNRFYVNASGVQRDILYYNDGNGSDGSWDAVWTSAAKAQPWGWSAEMKIPYHCLRFAEKETHEWGINFTRSINRRGEYIKWAYAPSSENGFVSHFGHLKNLTGISPSSHFEILPYVVSSMKYEPKSTLNSDGKEFMRNAGFDVKYALSTNLILDAAINPDFGQVELDQPILDLSSYETYFPERRPFFIEGADLFRTDFRLFYSRRIGRSPYNGVDDDEAIYYTNYPDATTILGSVKLTGKLAERTSIAFLNATTEEESADYGASINEIWDSTWNADDNQYEDTLIYADTVFRTGIIEPKANYSVFRIKQEVLKNSHIGGMITLASQDRMNPVVTGGVDWRLNTNNNKWSASGQVVFSQNGQGKTAYGIDATFDRTSGKHIRGAVGFTIKQPELNLNRLGYSSRSDVKSCWAWMQYRTNDDWWIVRNSYNNINYYSSWNYDGICYNLGGNFNTYIEFTNFWSLGGGFSFQAEKYSDRETRGNGLWEWPLHPTFAWWASLNTDRRKNISFNYNPGSGGDRGGWWMANYFGVDYRPKSNVELSAGFNYKINRDVVRWVDNLDTYNPVSGEEETMSVFGELSQDQIFLHTSASVVLNRNLSMQLSLEGLVAGLDYENYLYHIGGNDYVAPEDDEGNDIEYNYDYNFSALNSMFLMRWEYLPGSSLYLVWTRSRPETDESNNNLNLSRDMKRMFSGDAKNIFLIKTSYWMNI